MSEPFWKLIASNPFQSEPVVWRKWPDGRQESCLVSCPEIQAWIAEGNAPLPPDEPPVETP